PMLYAAVSMPVYIMMGWNMMFPLLLLFVMLGMTCVVLRGAPDLNALFSTVLPILYPGAMFTLVYPLQDIADPYVATVVIGLVFMSALLCDVFAWAVGKTMGRHPLCHAISPKKTVEGAVAGLFGAAAAVPVCLLLGRLIVAVTHRTGAGVGMPNVIWLLAASVLAGAFSQCGDLAASVIKRALGMKDYGNFLPGHGGIMDRIDSVVFSGVILYIFFVNGMRVLIL
ncbi:MAG: phosphatidate cytidylyltransferase, partial [Clostridia bacterium]|nr:phosphatidate cytidylyltransferase [Clostridia bacterium]